MKISQSRRHSTFIIVLMLSLSLNSSIKISLVETSTTQMAYEVVDRRSFFSEITVINFAFGNNPGLVTFD